LHAAQLRVPIRNVFREPEIEHGQMIRAPRWIRHEQVRRLDVAVNEADFVHFDERVRRLFEQMHDACRRHRTVVFHEPLQIDAVEELHRGVAASPGNRGKRP
jgi:hypothetical protein